MSTAETFTLLVYALIGISGSLSIVVFVWGAGVYLSRLGTERRVAGIRIMEWGIAFVFTSILLIALLRWLES